MRLVVLFALMMAASVCGAQEDTESTGSLSSKFHRAQNKYYAQIPYSHFDLFLPGKFGIAAGFHQDVRNSWEFEYLRGTLSVPFFIDDLGGMKDQRFTLLRRSYFGFNSFNLSYGVSYMDFSVRLGSRYMGSVTGGAVSAVNVVGIKALGFQLGLGNKWEIGRNFTLGVDWFSWTQPVIRWDEEDAYLKRSNDSKDREKVKDLLSLISYFPRMSFLKLQLGYSF